MKHIWTVLCNYTLIDKDSNNVSLINVIEEAQVHALSLATGSDTGAIQPGGLADFQLVSLWARSDKDTPEEGSFRIRIQTPKKLREFEKSGPFAIDLTKHRRLRSRIRIGNLPLDGDGEYNFIVEYIQPKRAKPVEAARVPVELMFIEAEQKTPDSATKAKSK